MRDHFHDAASAGAVCHRLHAFLRLEGEQAPTTITGLLGFIGATIGIGASLLLYKFTYGHPELRIPGMAIALFLGMYVSRVFVLGPLGFLIGFVVAVSQSVGEAVPSPELLVRGLLWLWVAIARAMATQSQRSPRTNSSGEGTASPTDCETATTKPMRNPSGPSTKTRDNHIPRKSAIAIPGMRSSG